MPLWGFFCVFQAEVFFVARYVREKLVHLTNEERYCQIPSVITDGWLVIRNWKVAIVYKQYSSDHLFTCHDAHKGFTYYKDCVNTGKKNTWHSNKGTRKISSPTSSYDLQCWRKTFANFASHNIGFRTDQCLFGIWECQVQIQDGNSDSSIENVFIFLIFSWQIQRYFLMGALDNCFTLTDPYRLSHALLCTCTSVHMHFREHHDDAAHCQLTAVFFVLLHIFSGIDASFSIWLLAVPSRFYSVCTTRNNLIIFLA